MRQSLTTILLSALLFAVTTPQAVAQYRLEDIGSRLWAYEIYVGTTPIGKATLEVKPLNKAVADTFVYNWTSEGLFKQNIEIFFLKNAGLRPIRSKFVSQKGEIQSIATFRYPPGRAIGKIRLQQKEKKERRVDLKLPQNTVDIGMLRYILTLLPLKVGKALKFSLLDTREGRIVIGKGWVSRVDSVALGSKTFACYRVEMFAGKAQEIDFVEIAPPHRLMRQIYPAVDIDLRLINP